MSNLRIIRTVELMTEAEAEFLPQIMINNTLLDPCYDEDIELLRPFAMDPNMVASLTAIRDMVDEVLGAPKKMRVEEIVDAVETMVTHLQSGNVENVSSADGALIIKFRDHA